MISKLKRFTTCDVSDALLKLGFSNGGFVPDLIQRTKPKKQSPLPLIGRAWTVQFVERSSSVKPNFEGHYIDQIPQKIRSDNPELESLPVIPILAAPPTLTCAILGGIMALRASVLRAPAIVVSGRVRDVDELDDDSSTAAVYSRGLSIVGAGAGSKVASIGTECEVTGYGNVGTGEIIMIDHNGIVVIPSDLDIAELLELMQALTSQDDRVKQAVKEGMKVQDAFSKYRTR